jgi:glycosyltransferase involved in cell wall biosynthesis
MSSISYIITVYNKAKALPKLIDGLRNQQGDFAREFIFVDDGSKDNSLELLKSLAKQVNGLVITQQNLGPSVAVNAGLKLAKNDWTFLVDGDDYLYPSASSTLLDLAQQYPNAVVCKGRHSNNPELEEYTAAIKYTPDALMRALKFYPIGASTSMIKTDIAQKVGGCDEYVFIQDYSIALRMARHGAFVEIDKLVAANINAQQQRLSSNKLQENYYTALARFLFLKDNLDISYQHKYYGLQHQLRKTWLWHVKHKFPPSFKHFFRYLATRVSKVELSDAKLVNWLEESIKVYNI